MNMYNKIYKDLVRVSDRKGLFGFLKFYYFHRGFRAVVLYRLANKCYQKKIRILPDVIMAHCVSNTGADIAYTANIGQGLLLLHPVGVVIGARCNIGNNVTMMQGVTLGLKWSGPEGKTFPEVGDGVIIGAGAKILGDVKIGNNAVIGANSVVLHDVPEGCTVVGVPAHITQKVIR